LGLVNAGDGLRNAHRINTQDVLEVRRATHGSSTVDKGERRTLQAARARAEHKLTVGTLRELVIDACILAGRACRVGGQAGEFSAVGFKHDLACSRAEEGARGSARQERVWGEEEGGEGMWMGKAYLRA
jgi:hypothetical protein